MTHHVLSIDQGTSSTKAVVVTCDGDVLGEAEIVITPTHVRGGGVEQDPHELLNSIVEAGRQALDAAGVEVDAVGIANQGETVVAWDEATGEPTSSALSWQDRRSSSVTEELRELAPRLTEISGLPLDPYFTAPKLRWLGDRQSGSRVSGIDAWANSRLTGRFVTDVTTASRSMLLDLETRAWSSEAASYFSIELDTLPEVVDCAGEFGETDAFGPTLPVTGLVVDQQAALIGEGCLNPGEAKCTYGTGAFFLVTTGVKAPRSSHGLSASVAWQVGSDHAYCLDGQIYSAGSAVEWLRRMGLVRDASELDALTSSASSSVVAVPSFAGLGAPYWEPLATAHFEGITLDTGPAELVLAVLEGVACQVAVLVRGAQGDLGRELSVLRVDGGLTQSSVLMQRQADLLQVPVELYNSPHATVLGTASLALFGAGVSTSIAPPVMKAGRRFEPLMSSQEAADRLGRWEEAAGRSVAAIERERAT